MKNIYSKIILPLYLFFGLASNALAQTNPLPTGRAIDMPILIGYISAIARFLITVGGLAAVIFIIIAGIKYMYAGANTTKVAEAQAMLKTAIIGAAIVFGVGVIIATIIGFITGSFFCNFSIFGFCVIP